MKAHVGDRLIMESVHVGDPRRVGVILALLHADGTPPYTVRWLDTGHEALVFPSADARIEQAGARTEPSAAGLTVGTGRSSRGSARGAVPAG